jgi:lipoate synthase
MIEKLEKPSWIRVKAPNSNEFKVTQDLIKT